MKKRRKRNDEGINKKDEQKMWREKNSGIERKRKKNVERWSLLKVFDEQNYINRDISLQHRWSK